MTAFSLVFFTFAVKFCLYTVVENPVWITSRTNTCITLFDDISYAARIAPAGAEGMLQGIVRTVYMGLGMRFFCLKPVFCLNVLNENKTQYSSYLGLPAGTVIGGYFFKYYKYYFVKVTEYHYIDFLYHSNYCKLISGSVVQKQ